MILVDIFRPDIYKKSIFDIDYQKLKKADIKCIIFDLDNTIAPLDQEVPNKKILDLFMYLEDMGFRVVILSNASKKRVAPFKEKCNVDSAYYARKPFKGKYQKIMDLYQLKDYQVACVGDQLLTDILGANKMGFTSILVNPVGRRERVSTHINRFFEKFIYHHLKKHGLFTKGEYYD